MGHSWPLYPFPFEKTIGRTTYRCGFRWAGYTSDAPSDQKARHLFVYDENGDSFLEISRADAAPLFNRVQGKNHEGERLVKK